MIGAATTLTVTDPTPDQAAATLAVRDAVTRWREGAIDVWGVRRRCSGRDRWTAARCTAPDDAAFAPLMACLDALIATDRHSEGGRHYRTRHGAISDRDVWESGGEAIADATGRVRLTFPGQRGVFRS